MHKMQQKYQQNHKILEDIDHVSRTFVNQGD